MDRHVSGGHVDRLIHDLLDGALAVDLGIRRGFREQDGTFVHREPVVRLEADGDKPAWNATYMAGTLIVSFTNCWKVLKDRTDSNPHQYLRIGGVTTLKTRSFPFQVLASSPWWRARIRDGSTPSSLDTMGAKMITNIIRK